jgi:hypothetical protein
VFTTESIIEDGDLVKIINVYDKKAVPENGLFRAYVYFKMHKNE